MSEALTLPRLVWQVDIDGCQSPFSKGSTRPFKLTFHNIGLQHMADEEQKGFDLICELANLKEFEVLQFSSGCFPHIEFHYDYEDEVGIHIDLPNGGWRKTGVGKDNVQRLSGTEDIHTESYQDFLALEAHLQCENDIFITASNSILAIRDDFPQYNIRTPIEMVKIMGLFLRHRENWAYYCHPKGGQAIADKREFYWVIMRSKLPSMWKYFSECLNAGGYKGNLTTLASSVLERCYTLLQARDELAKQFYGDNDHEVVLYHFNYFFLLITGVLDAQARILCHVYNLKCKPQYAGFTKNDFLKEVNEYIPTLKSAVTEPSAEALIRILHNLRNTIHGSGHSAQQEIGYKNKLHIMLSSEIAERVWENAQLLGCTECDGIFRREYELTVNGTAHKNQIDVYVEPYNFVSYLLNRGLELIDCIAKETKLTSQSIEKEIITSMPEDWHDRTDRFNLLGG